MEEQLKRQFSETLDSNKRLKNIVTCTTERLGLGKGAFFNGFIKYDVEHGTYDNAIYSDLEVRGALYVKYFIERSYHIHRQQKLTEFVEKCWDAESFVDIGYGAPGLYIQEDILVKPNRNLTLLDKFETAGTFSEALFSCIDPTGKWKEQITIDTFDFDTLKSPEDVFDVYIMFDSIEHAKNPTESMRIISGEAKRRARFILSLPIGPAGEAGHSDLEPCHFIEWLTDEEALAWVRGAGLKVLETSTVAPTEEDLWAEGADFYNLIVLAEK